MLVSRFTPIFVLLAALTVLFGTRIAHAQAADAPAPAQVPLLSPAPALPLAGRWQGALNIGGIELRLVVHIVGDNENLSGTLDSLDQGAFGIVITAAKLTGQTFRFECESIKGVFEGTVGTDGQQIVGRWTQGAQGENSLPLTIKRQEKETVLRRPQTPQPPFPYRSIDVTYPNPEAHDVHLSGTLILPPARKPLPVVLFIAGSGPNDRDETILGHKLFLVIADYLARRGIASLRYDKRGINKSTGNYATANSVDFMSDVLAGVNYLRGRREIDPKRIGLIGHSEGGMIAPMAATRFRRVAFIILLAGTGVPGKEIMLEQNRLISLASGVPPALVQSNLMVTKQLLEIAAHTTDNQKAKSQMRAVVRADIDRIIASQAAAGTKVPVPTRQDLERAVDNEARVLLNPWTHYFLNYDPAPTLSRVRCPVLILNGSKDLQVPPSQNLPKMRAALKAGHNHRFVIRELPGLNHLFQTCKTGAPAEYSRIEETFSPAALHIIGDWIVTTTRQK